jgi:hypothetical protein
LGERATVGIVADELRLSARLGACLCLQEHEKRQFYVVSEYKLRSSEKANGPSSILSSAAGRNGYDH